MAGRSRLRGSAQRGLANVDDGNAKFLRAVLNGNLCTLHRHRREKNTVGEILQMIVVAADSHLAFDPVVIRSKVSIVEWPVFTSSVVLPAFEVSLTHA